MVVVHAAVHGGRGGRGVESSSPVAVVDSVENVEVDPFLGVGVVGHAAAAWARATVAGGRGGGAPA